MDSEGPQVFSLDHLKANLAQVIAAGEKITVDERGGVCHWCGGACGGTCLGVNHVNGPQQMKTDDPAYWMLKSGHVSTPTVYRKGCYICEDPEYAQMGMSLCKPCAACTGTGTELKGHVPADDTRCDDCGVDSYELWMEEEERKKQA